MQRWKWDVLHFELITSSPILDLEQHLVLQKQNPPLPRPFSLSPSFPLSLSLSLSPSLSLSQALQPWKLQQQQQQQLSQNVFATNHKGKN